MVAPGSNKEPILENKAQEMSNGELAFGCVALLFLVFMLGQCMFGGDDESEPAPMPTPTEAAVRMSGKPVGSNILEQAILDAFPSSPPTTDAERKTASDAADYLGATINEAGFLCAQPVEAQQAAPGQYGVGCRRTREGGRANYLIDVRTGRVAEI